MRKVLLLLAALAALLVAAPRGASAQNAPAANVTLRVIHAAAGAPGVDVYVDGQLALESNDFFSEGTQALAPGDHEVVVVAEGEAASTALVGKRFYAEEGDSFTLTLIGSGAGVRGLLLKDRTSAPQADEARVRIIHAADTFGPVDVAVADGEPFLTGAAFGSSNLVDVPPGTYALNLSAAGTDLLRTVDLTFRPGWTYTLVVTGDSPENLWVQALVDRPGR